jgi:guanylate kinase
MGKIFIILGKSATGKDTIYKHLLSREDLSLKKVVMYTTRPIRKAEKEGEEYHFVNEEIMEELISKGQVIEYRTYNTVLGKWHYFTVDDGQVDLDRCNYLMHGTLESFKRIRDYYGQDKVVPIYVEVEDGERLVRAIKRESRQEKPNYAEVCRRYLADEGDFSEENIRNLGIKARYQNDDIEICLSRIISDIKNIL